MRISETKKAVLNIAESAIETAEQSIQFAEENLQTLNMDQEEEEEGGEQKSRKSGGKGGDPAAWLTRKEKRLYDKLSDRKKKQYLKEAMKKKEVSVGKKAGIKAAKHGTKAATSAGKNAGKAGAKTAASAAGGAATAGATVGVDMAVTAGKKTAQTFRNALMERSMAEKEKLGKMHQQMAEKKKNGKEKGGVGSVASAAGAAIVAPFVAMIQVPLSLIAGIMGMVSAILSVIAAVVVFLAVSFGLIDNPTGSGGADRIVQVALTQEDNTDGSAYWEYTMGSRFVDGHSTPWCACFVSWCANECGYIDDNLFPKSGSVATYREFYRQKGLLHEEAGYIPQRGDLILFGANSHIGIVQYVEDGRVVTIEGNTSDAVHTRTYSLGNSRITGYCTPEYPGGSEITIPDGMGVYYTYMGWHTITSTTSLQYQLREQSGERYDAEGFARIDGCYVIACTSTFGNVGDYIDFYREDGSVIHAVIGDIKNQNDAGCNEYGHDNGRCVVEYVVSSSWYPSHVNPGTATCHPEWDSRVIKAVNLGTNYFD